MRTTKLSDVATLVRGVSYPKNLSSKTPKSGYTPIFRANNISTVLNEDSLVYVDNSQIDSTQLVQEGDILIAMSSGSKHLVGKAAQAQADTGLAFGAFCGLVRPSGGINSKYLGYFFQSKQYRDYTSVVSKGSNINNLKRSHIENIELPIFEEPEQEKIVAKIEELFSEIDNSNRSMESIDKLIVAYRESLLFYSLSDLNPLVKETDWLVKPFSEVAEVKSNLVNPKDYPDHPHIAPNNIERNTGRLLEYQTIKADGVRSPKHLFFEGQIVYSKIRPYLNKLIIAPFEGLCSADMYPVQSDAIDVEYLYYFMLSRHFTNQSTTAGSRSVLPKINQRELSKVVISFPESKLVQQQIVNEIEMKLSELDKLKESTIQGSISSKTLKQSVLSKAFKGELV